MVAASRSFQNNIEVVNTAKQLMMRTLDITSCPMETDISFANTGILTKQEYDEANLVKTARDDGLDRNAFLTLLTTQLQSQNPPVR